MHELLKCIHYASYTATTINGELACRAPDSVLVYTTPLRMMAIGGGNDNEHRPVMAPVSDSLNVRCVQVVFVNETVAMVYWLDEEYNRIKRVRMDLSGRETVVEGGTFMRIVSFAMDHLAGARVQIGYTRIIHPIHECFETFA